MLLTSKKRKEKNYVLIFSLILTGLVVFIGILNPVEFNFISTRLFNILIDKFAPMYLVLILVIFVFSMYLAFNKYGDIKLGEIVISQSLVM